MVTHLVRERAVPGADADDGDVVEAGGIRHRRRGELAEAGLRHHYRVNLRRRSCFRSGIGLGWVGRLPKTENREL